MECQFCYSVLNNDSRIGVGLEEDESGNNYLKSIIREITIDNYEHICYKSDGFCSLIKNEKHEKKEENIIALVWNHQRFGKLINKLNADVIFLLSESE